MRDTKLIRFLMLFSAHEYKKFGLFVASPYFNSLNNVTRLYKALQKHHPEFKSRTLTKENIFAKIFPKQKYDDVKLRALFSYLLALAEKFMSSEEFYSDRIEEKIRTINTLFKKEETGFAEKTLGEVKVLLHKNKNRDAEFYYTLFKILFQENTLPGFFSRKRNFQKETDALTVYFIVTALRTYCTAYNIKSSMKLEVRTDLIEFALKLAQTEPYKRIPAVRMVYALYMAVRYSEEGYFSNFIDLMEKYPSTFSASEMYNSYILLLNFCVIKIQKGDRKFSAVKFELYKKMLDTNLTGHMKYFPAVIFSNIVTSALENNEPEFAKNFIEYTRHKLDPEKGKDVAEISMAKLYYSMKDYGNALEHLSKAGSNEDIFYKFAIKDIHIKIFYEQKEFETIYSIMDSYKHFLHSDTMLTEDVKKRYSLFLRMLNELLKVKLNYSEQKADEFHNMLTKSPGFIYKDWIYEKLSEMNP